MEKFVHPLYWRDVNLYGNHYPRKTPFTSLKAFAVPDLRRISFADAMKGEYKDARLGEVCASVLSSGCALFACFSLVPNTECMLISFILSPASSRDHALVSGMK